MLLEYKIDNEIIDLGFWPGGVINDREGDGGALAFSKYFFAEK